MGDKVWDELAVRLAVRLADMQDVGDHVVIELPDGQGGEVLPYAQFAGMGGGALRAELSGNAWLEEAHQLDEQWCEQLRDAGWLGNDDESPNWFMERRIDEAREVAALAVVALRLAFGVAHPQLMTYRAWGPHAEHAEDLGLVASADVPVELAEDDSPLVFVPTDRDELFEMVRATLEAKLGEAPTVDEDDDIMLMHDDHPLWVRVRPESPVVELMTPVAHDVHSRRSTAVEITVLNRNSALVKWNLQDRTVWQHLAFPGMPFVPAHLHAMLDFFVGTLDGTRDDLALRVGGRVA